MSTLRIVGVVLLSLIGLGVAGQAIGHLAGVIRMVGSQDSYNTGRAVGALTGSLLILCLIGWGIYRLCRKRA
jgi:hypothetical protein